MEEQEALLDHSIVDAHKDNEQPSHQSQDDLTKRSLNIEEAICTPGVGRFHYMLMFILGWANSADTIEMLSVSFILPYAQCELKATQLELGYLTGVGFAGMMIGSLVWASVADVRGRVKTLLMCQSMNALFTLISSLTQSFWFLVLCRFFSGIGVGGTNPLIFVFAIEFLPVKNRGKMMALLPFCFVLGQILIAGLAWWVLPQAGWYWSAPGFKFNNWRLFLLLSGIPVTSSVLLFLLFPESPRFLIQVNQMEAAKKALKRIYAMNGKSGSFDDDFTIQRPANCDESVYQAGVWNGMKAMVRKNINLFTRQDIRSTFIYSSVILSCLSFRSMLLVTIKVLWKCQPDKQHSYYGLTMWFPMLFDRMEGSGGQSVCQLNPANHTAANPCEYVNKETHVYFDTFLQAISSLPGNVLYFVLIDWIGRKLFVGVSMALSGVSVLFIWLVTNKTESIVMSCIYAGIANMSWNSVGLITTEIFPTDVRATARGMQSGIFNRLAAVLANLIFGAFLDVNCTVPLLLVAALCIIGALLTYKLPNTTNVAIN